jgi:hypothetical protein
VVVFLRANEVTRKKVSHEVAAVTNRRIRAEEDGRDCLSVLEQFVCGKVRSVQKRRKEKQHASSLPIPENGEKRSTQESNQPSVNSNTLRAQDRNENIADEIRESRSEIGGREACRLTPIFRRRRSEESEFGGAALVKTGETKRSTTQSPGSARAANTECSEAA